MNDKNCKGCCCGCESVVQAGIVAGHNIKEVMADVNRLLGQGLKIAEFNTAMDSCDRPYYSLLMVKCAKDKCQEGR